MNTRRPPRRPAVFTGFWRRFTDERALDLAATITLYNSVRKTFEASRWSHPSALESMLRAIFESIDPLPPPQLHEAFLQAMAHMLALETTIFDFPEEDPAIDVLSLKDQVDLRRFLRAKEHFLAHDDHAVGVLVSTLSIVFSRVSQQIPANFADHRSATFVVSLDAILRELAPTIDFILGAVARREVSDAGLLAELQQQLYQNVCRVSGINPADEHARKPLLAATAAGLPTAELAAAYLQGTPLLDVFRAPVPFALTNRFSHQHIVASTNAGKTNLLSGMIVNDFDAVAQGKASVIVLDSQGDLIRSIVRHVDFAPGGRLHDRLVYIDPTDIEYPLALNIFARNGNRAQTLLDKRTEQSDLLDLLLFLFGALKQEATGRQETLMQAVTALIQAIPDATLMTLNEIFEPFDKRRPTLEKFQQYLPLLDAAEQDFFRVDFNSSEFSQSRAQIRARIQSLVTDAVFRNMFSAPTQKLAMAAEMDAGKVIVINADEDLLKKGTEVFGRFFIAITAQAAQARQRIGEHERLPTYFYIDECYKFIKADHNVEKIFDTGRKYKLGLIISHQRLAQLSQALQSAASGAAIKMVHAPIYEDKRTLANQMRTSPEWLDSMPRHTFATHITGMAHPVALAIPLSPLANAPQMTESQFTDVRALMRRKYAQTLSPQSTTARPHSPAAEAEQSERRTGSAPPVWDSDHGEIDDK